MLFCIREKGCGVQLLLIVPPAYKDVALIMLIVLKISFKGDHVNGRRVI